MVQNRQVENSKLPYKSLSITFAFSKGVKASNKAHIAGVSTKNTENDAARRHKKPKTAAREDSAFNTVAAVGIDLDLDESVCRLCALLTKLNKLCQDYKN